MPKAIVGEPRELANQCVENCQEFFHITLDYSEESIQQLEDIIDQYFHAGTYTPKNIPTRTAWLFGCYLGEVMVRHLGVRWGKPHEDPARSGAPFIVIDQADRPPIPVLLIPKLLKRFQDAQGEDLVAFYDAIKRQVGANR
jgi:hypothetical protein